jgi:hypothetical protein
MAATGKLLILGSLACALAGAGCGSSSHPSSSASSGSTGATSTATQAGAGALSAEVRSAATGDIPDNQVFLVYRNSSPRYSMKYPEGWTLSGSGSDVTIRNKNNIVHILITSGPAPTSASMTSALQALKASTPTLRFTAPQAVSIGSEPALKLTYTTHSAPDPVTGRSVELIVDRYALHHAGRVATVDLGTPQGVDNVDAYRKMIQSFRWA